MTSPIEPKHERKVCPRCQVLFECKVGDVSNCQCSMVQLKESVQQYIQEMYVDCLCCNCLREVEGEYRSNQFQSKIKSLLRLPGTSR